MTVFDIDEEREVNIAPEYVQLDYNVAHDEFVRQMRSRPSTTKERVDFYHLELRRIAIEIQRCNSIVQKSAKSGNLAELEVAQTGLNNAQKLMEMERRSLKQLVQENQQRERQHQAEVEKRQSQREDVQRRIGLMKEE